MVHRHGLEVRLRKLAIAIDKAADDLRGWLPTFWEIWGEEATARLIECREWDGRRRAHEKQIRAGQHRLTQAEIVLAERGERVTPPPQPDWEPEYVSLPERDPNGGFLDAHVWAWVPMRLRDTADPRPANAMPLFLPPPDASEFDLTRMRAVQPEALRLAHHALTLALVYDTVLKRRPALLPEAELALLPSRVTGAWAVSRRELAAAGNELPAAFTAPGRYFMGTSQVAILERYPADVRKFIQRRSAGAARPTKVVPAGHRFTKSGHTDDPPPLAPWLKRLAAIYLRECKPERVREALRRALTEYIKRREAYSRAVHQWQHGDGPMPDGWEPERDDRLWVRRKWKDQKEKLAALAIMHDAICIDDEPARRIGPEPDGDPDKRSMVYEGEIEAALKLDEADCDLAAEYIREVRSELAPEPAAHEASQQPGSGDATEAAGAKQPLWNEDRHEVVWAGKRVTITAGQPRDLFRALFDRRGKIVAVDELAKAIGLRGNNDEQHAVRKSVSDLRRLFRANDLSDLAAKIQNRGGGYILDL